MEKDSINHSVNASNPPIGVFPIICLLFTAISWGVFWYPLRLMAQNGLNGLWSTLIMYSAACCVGLLFINKHLRDVFIDPKSLILIGIASGWCNVSFILAVIDGSILRIMLLFYLSPIWVTFLGWWLLKETVSIRVVLVLIIAIAGAVTMLWEPNLGYPWPANSSDWLALSSGFGFALANVYIRKTVSVSLHIKTFVSWIGVCLISLIWLAIGDFAFPTVTMGTVVAAICLGGILIFSMTWALQYGVVNMPVHKSGIILLFELVAGALSAYWLANETVYLQEWLGGVLIILAAILITRPEDQEKIYT